MRGWILALASIAVALTAAPAAAEMSWIEAAERLHRERGHAVSCARVAKRHLPPEDKAALSRMELSYEAARTEVMAVIAGLEAALIDDQEAPALGDLQVRLEKGGAARESFCEKALTLIPKDNKPKGERNLVQAALGLVKTLVEAGVTVWKEIRGADDIRRANLRTVLEDAKWPAFGDI